MSQLTPVTATNRPAARSAGTPAPSLAVRALDLVASEWIKFRSVRSSFWRHSLEGSPPFAKW